MCLLDLSFKNEQLGHEALMLSRGGSSWLEVTVMWLIPLMEHGGPHPASKLSTRLARRRTQRFEFRFVGCSDCKNVKKNVSD